MFAYAPLPSAEGNVDQEMTTIINITVDADEPSNNETASSSDSTQQKPLPLPPRSISPSDMHL